MIRGIQQQTGAQIATWRLALLWVILAVLASLLLWRALDLQVLDQDFLQGQGDARHLRVVEIPAHRGRITDRNGELLAISSPVDTVWAHPGDLLASGKDLKPLAQLLRLDVKELRRRLQQRSDKEFMFLRRHVDPEVAKRVMALNLPGVSLRTEYQRFYPAGEVTAHLLGFTSIDDEGQEGLELALNRQLQGQPGAKRVVKDRHGRPVRDVESLRAVRPGRPITLSIDRRLQYLAYRELKAAVHNHHAKAGSLVLLDVRTGEVLALVNQPAANPNNRAEIEPAQIRNRAVTDVFEPGSTMKPFAIAAALEVGAVTPETVIDTNPGTLNVGGFTVHDVRNYGRLDVASVIRKSSTVGAAKIALSLEPEVLWGMLSRMGFGVTTGSGFPGESAGQFPALPPRREAARATMGYGYGIAVTPLQLAQAYSIIAADGVLRRVSLLRQEQPPEGQRIISLDLARTLRGMLESTTEPGGTARRAAVPGYRVAGKTGTAKKAEAGGYAEDRYAALFAGMAPVSDPRLVMVVVVDEPRGQAYYGGQIAAPVFANVMAGALRLLNVPPDDLPALEAWLTVGGGA